MSILPPRVDAADRVVDAPVSAEALLGRDHAIDRLRGLCLLSMTFGHLTVSGPGRSVVNAGLHAPGWVSGAAGFVFLSGVSVGLLWQSKGEVSAAVKRWTLMRAVVLLGVHVLLNALAIVWSSAVQPLWWMPSVPATPTDLLVGRWMIPFGDVLPMYVVFMAAGVVLAPWVEAAPRRVVIGSASLYIVGLVLPTVGPMREPGDVVWDLFAWQLIFMIGLVAGRHWGTVRREVVRHRNAAIGIGLAAVALIVALRAMFALAEHGRLFASSPTWRDDFETEWLDKVTMAPLRVVLVFALGPVFYWLCTHSTPADRLLRDAGSRSLRVYVVSTMACLLPPLIGPIDSFLVNDVVVSALTVAVLATGRPATLGRGRPWSF